MIKNTPPLHRIFSSAALFVLTSLPALAQTDIKFPSDAPVLNVRNYGAKGDGIADDTQAFRDAIDIALSANDRYSAVRIIYIPNGTYKITGTIESRIKDPKYWYGWRSSLYLQGESRTGTILKLPNNADGFTSSSAPKAVIKTGSEQAKSADGQNNQAFRHYIRNLTVDIGAGNAGAVGIDYLCNNRGGIYNVTVRSSDANRIGHTGIRMDREWPGPAIIKNVTISGFSNGITMKNHFQFGMTFENITLQNQISYGIYVKYNTLQIRKLTSTNSVPVIYMETNHSHLTLLDATFTGGSSANAAIRNWGKVHARNVKSTGYGTVIQDNTGGGRSVTGGSSQVAVAEYTSHGPFEEYSDSINGAIRLPVEETPEYNTLDFTQWANVVTEGATPGNSASDDRAAIQAAIDRNKAIVYLPRGEYAVSDTIVIRGSVRKVIGLCASIVRGSGFPSGAPLIRFDGGSAPSTILQNLKCSGPIVHNSSKSLAMVNCDLTSSYSNTTAGTGDVFFEDVTGPSPMHIDHAQYAYGRQVNIEFFTGSFIRNQGGKLWLFGYKTEGSKGTLLENKSGWAELFGGFFYAQDGTPTMPMIINDNGKLSANYKLNGANYAVHVRDIRGTVTSDFTSSQAPDQVNCPLYSGSTQVFPLPNVAVGGTIAAVSAQTTGNEAGKVIDGISNSDSNLWSASGYPQWVEIDLRQDCLISASTLFSYQNRAYRFRIEGKRDGGSYATLVDRSTNTTAAPISNSFSPTTARYIKLTVTGASGYTGTAVSIRELQIFGKP